MSDQPWMGYDAPKGQVFPVGKREWVFGLSILVCGLLLSNVVLYGGFHLGFALAIMLWIGLSAGYLLRCGCKLDGYSGALLILSFIIAAGFARSDDGFVKLVMLGFLFVSVNLGLCLLAGQNRENPNGISSLLDVPESFVTFGLGKLTPAGKGVFCALKNGSAPVRKGGAVALGLVVAVPVLAILVSLLVSADAAFDGLVAMLPRFELGELIGTVIIGVPVACVGYSRGVGLWHEGKTEAAQRKYPVVSPLTVNTVLVAVCVVYLAYLFSQLAYFVGGFSGMLPEGFTMAEYARRGFFEMACLCAVNLAVMALAVGLSGKNVSLVTKLLCLFIGAVTVFLVATASGKMLMYIDGYGLTRLRVLTEVIMVFLGFSTVVVCVWLFRAKLAYMKWILIGALVIGATVFWVDVDAVVANYNVSAYQSGRLETIDMDHLGELGDGAVPYIARLTEDSNEIVAYRAREILIRRSDYDRDLRVWNFASWYAELFVEMDT